MFFSDFFLIHFYFQINKLFVFTEYLFIDSIVSINSYEKRAKVK